MSIVLGVDWTSDMASVFGGDLLVGELRKIRTSDVYDAADPTGPTVNPPPETYLFRGHAFSYDASQIDGENVIRGDWAAIILIGTITLDDAARATLDLESETDNVDTVIGARERGAAGDAITFALIADSATPEGEIEETALEVIVHFQPGVTTVANIEALIGSSSLVQVVTPGTGTAILDLVDATEGVALAGGSDATPAPTALPEDGDEVTIEVPSQGGPKTGVVINVGSLTQASVTIQARGPSVG